MNKETVIMKEIEDYLIAHRIWYHRAEGSATSAGVPDLLVCYEGRFVGLEVKTPDGKPTELQKRVIGNIKASGGWGGFPKSLDEAIRLLIQSA